MQICFQFNRTADEKVVGTDPARASITINAPIVTGAEQNIVILDDDGRAIAIVEMQPGYDREEIEQS
jgi:hypothetical protein